jgi:alpha-glucosidase
VPIPWSGGRPPYGFGPGGAPWLPQPPDWAGHTVEAQAGRPGSMFELYRAALRLRREHPGLGDGSLSWSDAPAGALAFARARGFRCLVNVTADPLPIPDGTRTLLASGPLDPEGRLPRDTAAWLDET